MAIYKHKIDFDPTDAANHDRVGSFLIGAGGGVVTSTDLGGGVIGLDVNVGNMTLDADAGVFAEDAAASSGDKGQSVLLVRQDSLAISTSGDGDYGHFKSTDKGELYVHDADSLTALNSILADTTAILADTATIDSNLASLVKEEDAAAGSAYKGIALFAVRNDAGGSLVSDDGDFASLQLNDVGDLRAVSKLDLSTLVADDDVSTEKPLLAGAVARTPVSALTAVSASGDKVSLATDLHRRLWVNDSMAVAWQVTAVTLGTSALQLDATPLATRRKVTVQNLSNAKCAVKNNNTVTLANGIEIPKYSERDFMFTAALPLWAIGASIGMDIRIMEEG